MTTAQVDTTTVGVLGARGFLGQHVTRDLAARGHRVVALARTFADGGPTFAGVDGVEPVALDVWDRAGMRAVLPDLDVVVQLVGTTSPATGGRTVAAELREHVLPHAELLDDCVEAGVRRVVFASSGGTVYGPAAGTDGPITEQHPTDPINAHGISKLMIEKALAFHGHLNGLEHVTLRIANAYGPGQTVRHGQGLIPALLERHRTGRPVTVIGDGSVTRDFVYVDDVARAVRAAVELGGRPQLTVNVGTGVGTSVLSVIRMIESMAGIEFRLEHQPARETDVPSNVLDVHLAEERLGWVPSTDLASGLAATLHWHGLC